VVVAKEVALPIYNTTIQIDPECGLFRDVWEHQFRQLPSTRVLRHPDFIPTPSRFDHVSPSFQLCPMTFKVGFGLGKLIKIDRSAAATWCSYMWIQNTLAMLRILRH